MHDIKEIKDLGRRMIVEGTDGIAFGRERMRSRGFDFSSPECAVVCAGVNALKDSTLRYLELVDGLMGEW